MTKFITIPQTFIMKCSYREPTEKLITSQVEMDQMQYAIPLLQYSKHAKYINKINANSLALFKKIKAETKGHRFLKRDS